jgi:rhodanese-related sulfurtransferase
MKTSIHPQSTMKEVLAVYPSAQRALFRHYHIGGCASCAFQPDETLAALSARHNLNTDDVLQQIETSHQQDLELEISPVELAAQLPAGGVHLVDVRSREEFEAMHIGSAVLLSQPVMQNILANWSRTELLVLYDHRGQHSLDAAAYFIGQGFRNVRGLRGGIDAWSREVDAKIPRYRLEMTT